MRRACVGGSERGRTSNPRFRRPVLYPLSYGSSLLSNDAEREGFEPSVQENPIRRFSKPVPSATRPSLQMAVPACQTRTTPNEKQGGRALRNAPPGEPLA